MSEPHDFSEAATEAVGNWIGPAPVRTEGELAGQFIAQYQLLEEIGQGGMGTVWLAQQSEPVKRRVALKIIKLGMDTKEVVARFAVERQALALMDHAHIAKVLDAGATSTGRPYFVMELVQGAPITKFCDQAKLDLRARLKLFVKVCQAIQHAHNKGIIHRDVKPSNVLVGMRDGEPVPKVIDFGIAKATGGELTQKTLHTSHAQIIGTPEYMAPEQAERNGLDIDTRADIYSLGVLLYELLTGSKTFNFKEVMEKGQEEVLRTIREVDPAKPSTCVSTMGEQATGIASNRHMDSELLNKRLQGDLDWIVMKALEKERSRRYETALGFATDIERYLHGEAVEAAPPSVRYRLRKLLFRHKKMVLALSTIGLLLLAGSVGTGIGWWRTSRANRSLDEALSEKAAVLRMEAVQRSQAEASEQRAELAKQAAEKEAARAAQAEAETRARADDLAKVADFQAGQLAGLNVERMGSGLQRALLSAVPASEREAFDRELAGVNFTSFALRTLRENLFDQTVAAIDAQFAQQPLVHAQLLQTSSQTLRKLGLIELALDPQERALSLRRKTLGDEHPATLTSINNMGLLLNDLGRPVEAEVFILEALEARRRVLGAEHPDTLVSIGNLAHLLHAQGRLEQAEPLYREVLALHRRLLGNQNPGTLISINNMGYLLQAKGELALAEPYCREALQVQRQILGDEDPDTLTSMHNLGFLLLAQGKLIEAEAHCQEAMQGRRRVLGDEHPSTLMTIGIMGMLRKQQGELSLAEPYYREAFEGFRKTLGPEHPYTLTARSGMGILLYVQGEFSAAEPYIRDTLDARRRLLGDLHPSTLSSLHNLGNLMHELGQPEAAKRYLWEALFGRRQVLGEQHPDAQLSLNDLGTILSDRMLAARQSGTDLALGLALADFGELQLALAKYEVAERLFSEALDLLFAEAPDGASSPWLAQASLAMAIAGQARLGEAESMLLESADWFLDEEQPVPASDPKPAAVERVLQQVTEFYTAWHLSQAGEGHDAKAAAWQAKLDAWTAERARAGD